MAEDSLFWEGTATGHAASSDIWSAPYSALEMSDLLSTLFGSDAAKGYVIPGFGNDLKVQANSPVALNVIVKSGRLMLRGRLYGNTADNTLTLSAADATNPRLDRIVARISFAAQTITLAVLAGTPAATPSLPSLTQNATTYEIGLAHVWVAATATTIADTEIHDERIFAANFESLFSTLAQPNLLTNSEFMAFSRLNTVLFTSVGAPDKWEIYGTVTTWANLTKPSQMSRGRAVKITAGAANSGMHQTVRVKASTTYAIKGLIQVTAGDVGSIVVTTNSASPATVTKLIRRTGAWLEYLIYYTTEADASTLTLRLLGSNNTDIVDFGQWLIVEGYVPGAFRQIRETIIFNWAVYDSNWDNNTKSSSGTTIDLDTDFQGLILPGTIALQVSASMLDSGSAGAPLNTVILSIGSVDTQQATIDIMIQGQANNASRFQSGLVYLNEGNQFYISVGASGVNTASPLVRITGVVV